MVKPKSYHRSLQPHFRRALCPICKQAVYSTAGVHPQCAMSNPDEPGGGWGDLDHTVAILAERTSAGRDEEGSVEIPFSRKLD